jgi:hypothetical protein
LSQQLADAHRIVLVHEHLRESALDLRAEGCLHAGFERACAHHFGNDACLRHRVRDHFDGSQFDAVEDKGGDARCDEPRKKMAWAKTIHHMSEARSSGVLLFMVFH